MITKRCAIYIRVSTAMQRLEGWSLDAQAASLKKTAAAAGWKVIGIYADEGFSARKRLKERKEIFRLLDDVRAGLVDVILFKDLDRWFRNVSDFYKVQEVLDAYGVTWRSEQQPSLEMVTKEGRLAVNVLLSVGQNEADATSDRIKYTNKYMRSLKRWTMGPSNLPLGYTTDADHRVIIDPEREPVVRDLIETFKRTGSIHGSMLEVAARQNYFLSYTPVRKLLHSPMLYGAYKEVPDFIEAPYMSKEEWDELQALVRRSAPGRDKVTHFYLFTGGVAVCGCCGHQLIGASGGNFNNCKSYKCYVGNTASVRGPRCSFTGSLSEKKIEAQLLEKLEGAVADLRVQVLAVQAQKKARPKSNRAVIEKRLDKLEDLYINSDRMTRERYEEKRAEILAQLVDPEEPVEPTGPDMATVEKLQALLDSGVLELYNGFTPEEKRRFWRGIVDHFEVTDRRVSAIYFL